MRLCYVYHLVPSLIVLERLHPAPDGNRDTDGQPNIRPYSGDFAEEKEDSL